MGYVWTVLAAASFLLLGAALLVFAWADRRIVRLAEVVRLSPLERAPRISVVAPALNEERNLEPAVRSLLAQDYPDYEVVIVDDRSTDATPAILARLAAEDRRLKVVTVRELPEGWLGKNHANMRGAAAASGEVLLFTDADVVLAPSTLDRAVAYLERHGLDHLTAAPATVMPGLVNQFTLYFGLLFTLYVRPWAARDPTSRAHVGIGAFNMVRAAAYRAIGGHERIRLRPDDDLKLGKLLKLAGFRQDFVAGRGLVSVEWYASWRGLRDGLMKNLFAGAEYRTARVAAGVAVHVLLLALPPFALAWTQGLAWQLNLSCLGLYLWAGVLATPAFGTARWAGVLLPFLALFGAYLMVRATWLTLARGGIEWRGTRYPLAALRANDV
jgi:hypothetical protein